MTKTGRKTTCLGHRDDHRPGRRSRSAAAGREAKAQDLEAQLVRRTEILQQFSAALLLTDPQGRVTYVNPAFEKLGRDLDQPLIGRTVRDLVRRGWDKEMFGPLAGTIRDGRPGHGYLSRRENGMVQEWEIRSSILKQDNGAVIGYIVSLSDVTDERKIEKRFRQVQKMEALGNLARGIAHDLRNIFSPIIVNLELLLVESGREPRERAFLEQGLRAARRGKDLVDQITIFSRGAEEAKKIVSLSVLVEDALQIFKANLPPGVTIKKRFAEGDDRVFAPPAQIHQVVMNLLGNAIEAMAEEGGILTILLKPSGGPSGQEPTGGAFVALSVGDTGCGIPDESRDRIFEPFFTTKAEGSGMGLAVVHGIVMHLGGSVTVESEPGRGSVFHVFLPRAKTLAQAAGPSRRGRRERKRS